MQQFARFIETRAGKILALGGFVVINIAGLRLFSAARWSSLWPQPALSIMIVLVLLIIWLRMAGWWHKTIQLRLAGSILILLSQIYVLHSIQLAITVPSFIAWLHLLVVGCITAVISLGVFNQLRPRDRWAAPRLPTELPAVAVVVPTYGEPLAVLEPVVRSAAQLDYPAEKFRVYISDDGHRAEVEELAAAYGAIYNRGAQRDAKAGNLNSCLPRIHQHQPDCDLILTEDADEVLDPSFLRKLVGYFSDPAVAFVQTPKECIVPVGDPFGTRDRVFYDTIQVGRNGANAAFACGSGVIWRISAVESVGGFNTWNLVEDMSTSYELHNAGYRSDYHNEILTAGLSPDDIPGLLKQRGTWAVDTWRMFLFDNPLFKRGKLSLWQRLQYLELGLFYLTAAFMFPLAFLIPVLTLLLGLHLPVEGSVLFTWLLAQWLYFLVLADGSWSYAFRTYQYWLSHAPTYLQSFWIAVRSRHQKPKYTVTRKTRVAGFYGNLLWKQLLLMLIGLISIGAGLWQFGPGQRALLLPNAGLILYYLIMVNGIWSAAFYNVSWRELSPLAIPAPLRRFLAGNSWRQPRKD